MIFSQIDTYLAAQYEPEKVSSPENESAAEGTILFQLIKNSDLVRLDAALEKTASSFSERILELLSEKKLNPVRVYKKAHLDRRLFSKLRSNPEYVPTWDTAILLSLAMELTYDETVDLLSRAGLAFSNHRKKDVIAQFFINNQMYDIPMYKDALYQYGLLKDDDTV